MGRSNDRYSRSSALTGTPLAPCAARGRRGWAARLWALGWAALLCLAPTRAWAVADPSGPVVLGPADVGHDPSAVATLLDWPLGQLDPPLESAELENQTLGSTQEPDWKGGR